MTAYRICLAAPPAYAHFAGLSEVARLLWLSIRDCGHACDFTLNDPARDRTNILIGYHLLPFSPPWSEVRTVVWQLEQLDETGTQWNPTREAHLRHADAVWDFSPQNIAFLKKKGIPARPLVPGHHPGMGVIDPASPRDHDILFYGSIGPRRKSILDQLAREFRVQALFGVYGSQRDAWIARSRLVINIHHYPAQLFEAVRLSHLLSNGAAILSETSRDLPWPDIGLQQLPYEDLVAGCRRLLADEDALDHIRRSTHRQFAARYPMVSLVRPLLEAAP
jgi:hypothetical protein